MVSNEEYRSPELPNYDPLVEENFEEMVTRRVFKKQIEMLKPQFLDRFDELLRLYEKYQKLLDTIKTQEYQLAFLKQDLEKQRAHNVNKKEIADFEALIRDTQNFIDIKEKEKDHFNSDSDFFQFKKAIDKKIKPYSDDELDELIRREIRIIKNSN